MTLILPPSLQNKLRPLASAATEELFKELHLRGELHELTGTIAIPEDAPNSLRDNTIQLQTAELYRQMGIVIGQSGFSFTYLERTPVQELVGAKIILCRHPALPNPQAPAGPSPQLVLTRSGKSSTSDE